ncbi:CHAT domain-containing protein [Sorangium sp. So ce216]
MERRLGGFSREDIEEGIEAIRACSSARDIERAIQERPVLRAPIFHSVFRREVASILEHNPEHPIEELGRSFFYLLHRRAHEQLLRDAAEREAEPMRAERTSFVPPYFRALVEALDGRLPPRVEAPLRPDRDEAIIREQVAAVAGPVELPAYEVARGTCWSALVVGCPRCGDERLIAHVYLVGLDAAYEMKEHLVAGRINEQPCHRCGLDAFAPRFVWVQEGRGPGDLLNAAAALWHVRDAVVMYRPPQGARREAATDRVLEERAGLLIKELDLRWPAAAQQAGLQSIAIAYTNAELVELWEQADSPDAVPFAMQAMIWDIGARIEQGLFPPAEVEEQIRHALPNEACTWPSLISSTLIDRRPHALLAQCLIAEATSRVNGSSPSLRALIAGETAAVYLTLGEVGLGEVALARADDLLAEAPKDAERDSVEIALMEWRAALLVKLGNHASAADLRAALLARVPYQDSIPLRVNWHRTAAARALSLFRTGKFAEAFEAFRAETVALQALARDAEGADSEEERALLPAVQYARSGALANWSTLLGDLADYIEVNELLLASVSEEGIARYPSQQDVARAPPEVRARLRELVSTLELHDPERLHAMNAAVPALVKYLEEERIPAGASGSGTVRAQVRRMLEQALELSETVGGWAFAAIQADRLASMMQDAGEYDDAERAMRKVLELATRVGDHRLLIKAYMFFADVAGRRRDGAEALTHVRNAAREALRGYVGFGQHARDDGTLGPVGYFALQCARFGAPPVDAIVVAESLKSLSMTAGLARGMSFFSEEEKDVPALARWRQLREQREELERRAVWEDVGEQLRALDVAVEEARYQASLRDPRYARWSDATVLDVPAPEALPRSLRALGENTTYVGFFRCGDEVWTYAAWPGGAFVPRVQPWPFGDGEQCLSSPDAADLDPQLLRAWAEVLLRPLEARIEALGADDALVISLHEGLEHIPFAALPFQGRRLCERARISYVESLGMLGACAERATALGSAACVGDPTRFDLDPLPAAAREAEDIAALFRASGRKADLLTGEQATFRALGEAAAAADVLHFACHAEPDERSSAGALPRLMLAADAENNDSGALSDERILVELRLKRGCFVNLAACSSARRGGSAGPLVKGLVPAFLVAGASAVLATLWPIEDTHAARFNAELYAWLLAGTGPAASLAEAQRACVSGRLGDAMRDPAAWAGYQLFGTG